MSDDLVNTALTAGGSLITGGGITAWAVRLLFAGFGTRLDKIEKTLEELSRVGSERHESMIDRLARVESKADAAHRRLDDYPATRRKR